MRVVKHQLREAKTLYDFTLLQQSDDDKNRVVFLSERDMSIIWTAVYFADKVQPRVFYDGQNEFYNVVSDEDFQIFKDYVNSLRVTLGEWPVSNQYLERIAIALEAIQAKQGEFLQWDDMIDDLETALGIGNAFTEILKWIGNLFPSLKVKVDATPIMLGFWEYYSWKAPLLALLTAANASLAGLAAAELAEKPLSLIRTVTSVFDSILSLNNRVYEFILGDWNWYDDILKPIWESFISGGEGGTGGTDPDADPTNRIAVNINQTNIDNDTFSPTINVSCTSCGGSAGSCGCGGSGTDGPYAIDPPANPGQPAPTDPPADWPDSDPETFFTYKCQAANVLVLNFAEYLAQVRSSDSATPSSLGPIPQALLDWIGNKIAAAQSAIGPVQQFVIRNISTLVALFYDLPEYPATGDVELTAMAGFGELRLAILADREALVCDLYNAQNITEATAAFTSRIDDWLTGASYSADELGMIEDVSKSILTNYWTNRLFTLNAGISGYSDTSAINCELCDGCMGDVPEDWTLGDFGENLTVVDGIIRAEPTLFAGNNTYYVDIVLTDVLGDVSNVALHIKASPAQTYRLAVVLFDAPGGTQLASATGDFVTEDDLSISVSASGVGYVLLEVREQPAVAPTDYDWVEFSEICIS